MKLTTFLLFFAIFLFACEKKEKSNINYENLPHQAVPINSESKDEFGFRIITQSGHSSAGCEGCLIVNGTCLHVDCQGGGSLCEQRATIYLYPDDYGTDLFFAVSMDEYDLTDGDFFLMPDRSLYIVGANGEFLNIPEQILYREEETGKFIFYDIFFSDYQAFVNN